MSDKKVNPQPPAPPPTPHKELGHVPAKRSYNESKTDVITFFSPPPAPTPPKQGK